MKFITTFLRLWAICFACALYFLPASGQVSITSLGTPYVQNFNTLGNSGPGMVWSDNTTIIGWYADELIYDADSGFSPQDGLFSYGFSPASDRALGSVASPPTGPVFFGVRMTNNTGTIITSFDIAYAGEQWRCANNLGQLLDFQYMVNADSITNPGPWTDFNSLDFTSPQTCPDTGWRDGNNALNRNVFVLQNISVTVNAGSDIWFRWVDADDINADDGLAIDDLTITANGCTGPTTSNSVTNISCNGQCNGAITTNPTGGTPPYTYNWTGGAITQTINSLCPGTYTVTVTDNIGCTATANSTVTQPSALVTINSVSNVTCNGQCNGAITTNPTGGIAPYSYIWSNSGVTQSINSLCAGSYTVTVTDNNGCTTTASSTVTQPTALISNAGLDATICQGSGTIIGGSPSATGGISPYTFTWNPLSGLNDSTLANPTANPSSSRTYVLSVTDNNGCVKTDTVLVFVNNPATASAGIDATICSGSTYTLSGIRGGSATSSTWTTSGTGGFDNATLLAATYTPSAGDIIAGSVTLTITTNDPAGPCPAASDAMILTINPIATAGAGTDATICEGSVYTLSGTRGGSATSSTWTTSGTGTFDNPNLVGATYTPSGSDISVGSVTLSLTTNDPPGPCPAASDAMLLTINQAATAGAGIDAAICYGSTYTLSGSRGGSATSSTWTTSGSGTFDNTAILNAVYTPSAGDSSTGTVTLTLTTNDPDGAGPCTAASDAMLLTINSASVNPSGASAAPNPVCNGNSTTLSLSGGSLGFGASWQWYSGACGGTPVGTGATLPVTPLGTTSYFVRAEGTCNTTSCVNIVVTVNSNSTAAASVSAAPNPVCAGNSTTLTLSGGSLGTGASWQWYSGSCGGTVEGSGPSLIVSPGTTTTYYVRAEGVCNTTACVSTTVTVNSNSTAAASVSASVNPICNGSSTTLSVVGGSLGSGASWQWYTGFCGGTFAGSGASLLVSPFLSADYFVRAEGSCNTTTCVLISVIVDQSPTTANAGSDQNLCSITSTTLAGNTPSAGAGIWSVISGTATVTTPSSPTSTVTGLIISASATLQWTISNGVCPNSADTVIISVNDAATANAGADGFICDGNSYTLSGSIGGSASLSTWSTAGTGSFDNANLLTAQYTPSAGDISAGSVTLTLTTDDPIGLCTAASDAMLLTINQAATVSAGADNVICQDSTITLLGSRGGSATSSTWTTSGTGTFNDPSLLTAIYTPSGADVSAGSVTLSITTNDPDGGGPCIAASDTMALTIYAASTNPTGTSASVNPMCTGNSTVLSVSGGSLGFGSGWAWYSGSCGGTPEGTGPSLLVLPTVTTTYYVRAEGPCNFTSCVSVIVNVDQMPTTPNAGPDQDLCNVTSTVLSGNTPTVGTGLWEILSGVATIVSPNSPTSSVTGLVPGASVLLRWSISNGACVAINDNIYINVYDIATANAGADGFICSGYTFTTAGNTGGGASSSTWTTSGTGSFDNANLLTAVYTPSASDISAGSVTLVLTTDDPAGPCLAGSDTMTLYINSNPSVTTSNTDVLCNGGNDGTATANPTGGTLPYIYLWDDPAPAQSTQTATGLSIGTFNVTVTDAKGCITTGASTINEPATIVLTTGSVNSTCGNSNGQASVSVTGGISPYVYNWSGGCVTDTCNGLAAGGYTVTVTDVNSCTAVSNATVNNTGGPTVSIPSFTNVSCFGMCDGTATANVTGGTPPITYTWINGQFVTTATGLCAGTYTITVSDNNGCLTIDSVTITEPAVLTANTSATDVLCNGGSDGTSSVTASGGGSPYSYVWTGGQITPTATGLIAGTYFVTVTDNNNCTVTASGTVTEPLQLTATTSVTDATCYGCNDGTATATPSGGTLPYGYTWSASPVQNTQVATGLTAGTYFVTVDDANGCSVTGSATVTEPPPVNVVASVTANNASCNGLCDGSATASASGGTPPYTYTWSNGSTASSVSGLCAGSFSVIVQDNSGGADTVSFIINEPTVLIATVTGTNVSSCGLQDGAIDLTVTGGITPYNFNWSNGAATEDIANIGGGYYYVVVTDANGCTVTGSATVTAPPAMTLSTSVIDASACNASDGAVDLTVSGGIAPFTFVWSSGATTEDISGVPSGNHSATVIDAVNCHASISVLVNEPAAYTLSFVSASVLCAQNCDGSILVSTTGGVAPFTYLWNDNLQQNTSLATGLCAGTYSVVVNDANGCMVTGSAVVLAPSPLALTMSSTNATLCGGADGTASVSVSGGTPPYEFSWSNGSTLSAATNLPGGTHYVTVLDSNDCVAYGTATVSDNGGPVITVVYVVDVACAGIASGAINISVTGGLAPYTYLWSNARTTQDINAISGGDYEVEVTDASGCKATKSISVAASPVLSVSVTTVNSSCGSADGSAGLNVSGGVSPYSYQWSVYSSASSISGLGAGSYGYTVTDANYCEKTGFAVVSDNGGPVVAVDSVNHIGCGDSLTGAIYISVSGGTAPYNYSWSNGATTEDIENQPTGNYSLVVADTNGCITSFSDSIKEDPPVTDPICLVTVDSTGFNRIVWTKAGVHIAFYNIYRETGNSGNFLQLGTVYYADESSFLDTFSNPEAKSWRYKLGVVDSCGNESAFLSPMHKTIYLNLYQAGPGIVLVWDPYYGFYYNDIVIYRGTAPDSLFPLDTIPVGGNSYFDANPPQSILIYYNIAAIHPTGCTALKIKTYNASKSNTASLQMPVRLQKFPVSGLMAAVYPNPAKDKVNVLATGFGKEIPILEIYDIIGQKIYGRAITDESQVEIDVSGWNEGIYSIRLTGEREALTRKFVVGR